MTTRNERGIAIATRLAVAAAAAMTVSGCALLGGGRAHTPLLIAEPAERYKEAGQAYVFTIWFDDKGCFSGPPGAPAGTSPVESDYTNCPNQEKDCVRGRAGEFVTFQARRTTDPNKASPDEFVLEFHPFVKGPKTEKAGIDSTGGSVTLQLKKNKRAGKVYTFVLVSKTESCEPVDPQIILD